MCNVFEYYSENDVLAHHGIKGQKWGVRRYQNPDGTYTEAGKKKYFNADGSLNYKGLQKQRKDDIAKNPYGHPTGRGYAGTTAEQRNRKLNDRFFYGDKGYQRIQDRMASGKNYYQAKRPERMKAAGRFALGVLGTAAFFDIAYNGADGIKNIAKGTIETGKICINNMAGVYGKIPVAQAKFDEHMLKYVFD